MIDKITNNQISDVLKEIPPKRLNGLQSSAENIVDASLQVSYEWLVEKAQRESAEDLSAVERARQLLLSGQLDTPENIRKAAENILKFGV